MTDTTTRRFRAANGSFDIDAAMRAGRNARTTALADFLRLSFARLRRPAARSLARRHGMALATRPRRPAN